jgi:hypothetical protein
MHACMNYSSQRVFVPPINQYIGTECRGVPGHGVDQPQTGGG